MAAYTLITGEFLVERRVATFMRIVAIRADHILLFVRATQPQQLAAGFLMAAQATRVSHRRVRKPPGAKAHVRGGFPATSIMSFAKPVAAGAGGGTTAIEIAVRAFEYLYDVRIVVD
ncbi:MAG: hypothetical protein Hals2KO_28460 [Halioglobus sp.]